MGICRTTDTQHDFVFAIKKRHRHHSMFPGQEGRFPPLYAFYTKATSLRHPRSREASLQNRAENLAESLSRSHTKR